MTPFKKNGIPTLGLVALAFSGALFAAEPLTEETLQPDRAVIHFADLGGIKNWRAVSNDVIEIEGRNGNWFRAELWSHCVGLRSTETIGFITEPNGDLDSFSSIYVGQGERCHFKTFEPIEAPSHEEASAKD